MSTLFDIAWSAFMAIAEFMMLFSMFAMIVLTLTVIVAVAASCCYGDDR